MFGLLKKGANTTVWQSVQMTSTYRIKQLEMELLFPLEMLTKTGTILCSKYVTPGKQ